MVLENKLGITESPELARQEEIITKRKAKALYESGDIDKLEIGTFKGLSQIHAYLFSEVYEFAGKIRDTNISKDGFSFAPRIFLEQSLDYIDKLPQSNFDEIIDKYADMNVAHPFREGNGRSTRIWLDLILKKELGKIVDWNKVDKDEYFNAMVRSHVSTGELKYLLQKALTDDLSREIYMKGIDHSYYYEGQNEISVFDIY